MREALISLAVLAAIMIGGRLLLRRRRGSTPLHVPSGDGTFTLVQPRRNAILLGVTALVPAVVLGLIAHQVSRSGGAGFAGAVGATLVALAAATYLFASAARSRLIVRDTGIERVGVFGRRVIGWTSVAKIAFNPSHNWFFFTMSDGSHLWVPADVAGAGDFATLVLRRVRPAVLEGEGRDVREVLEELAAGTRRETHS
jgi:hypothetical protein